MHVCSAHTLQGLYIGNYPNPSFGPFPQSTSLLRQTVSLILLMASMRKECVWKGCREGVFFLWLLRGSANTFNVPLLCSHITPLGVGDPDTACLMQPYSFLLACCCTVVFWICNLLLSGGHSSAMLKTAELDTCLCCCIACTKVVGGFRGFPIWWVFPTIQCACSARPFLVNLHPQPYAENLRPLGRRG